MQFLVMSKKHLLAVVLLTSLASYQVARAQESLQLPSPEVAIPGVAQKSPISAPLVDASAYANLSAAEALATTFKDKFEGKILVPRKPRTTPGLGPLFHQGLGILLFRNVAPSVVLIRTKDASGSGSVLQGNDILTGLHVVDHNREVTVVFKPANPNGKANPDEVVKGEIVKVDVQRDLALIRPRSLPSRTIRPLDISTQDIEVGADVHAIGHPLGQDWTYTKGVVSSVRPDYEWAYGQGQSHRGTIIQTQTPLNPGNSGGPLLSDDGKIVGVNLFVTKGAEGINFAVAAKEIR